MVTRTIDGKYHIEVRTTGKPEPNQWEPVIVNTKSGEVLPDDEPLILFRGKDKVVRMFLYHYRDLCNAAGSPQEHLRNIDRMLETFVKFAVDHPERMKRPD